MTEHDVVIGLLNDVAAYPVPSLQLMLGANGCEDIPTFQQSMSAVAVLRNSRFISYTVDGEQITVTDLSHLQVIAPVVYGLRIGMAGFVEIE